jgi:nucleolar GTP-binding protein
MYRIPTVLTPDEILDKAFKRAGKVQVVAKDKTKRQKKLGIAKVRRAANTISSTMNRFVKSFPSFDSLSDFYYDLFDVTIGIDAMKKSLGALDWCGKTAKKIANDSASKIAGMKDRSLIKAQVSSTYGRLSSIVKQISRDLEFLDEARGILRKAPVIDDESPTIVIAGAPNVGKSLLVGGISSAKPKIASYPFTTKGISVGHFEINGDIYQVIDTPGLLDREMEMRNEMEIKAILALSHLANVIVYILDPSEYCGYSIESQLNILEDIRSSFHAIPILEVENKKDIETTQSQRLKISALEGDGMEELKEAILEIIGKPSN